MTAKNDDLQRTVARYVSSITTKLGDILGTSPTGASGSKSDRQGEKMPAPLREKIGEILGVKPGGHAKKGPATEGRSGATLFGQTIGQILGTEPLDRVQSAMNEEIVPESPGLGDASGNQLESQSPSKSRQQAAKGKKPLYKDGEGKLYYRASPNWTAEQKAKYRL